MTLPLLSLLVIFSVDAGKGSEPLAPSPVVSVPSTSPLSSPPSSPPSSTGSTPLASLSAAELPARLDALYAQRDDRRVLAEQRHFLEERVRQTPSDFEIVWRAARVYFWLGDDPSQSSDERSKLGKTGWDYAERAITLAPQRVEGHYWAAVNMGNYALGLGVVKALSIGLEGKFRERLGRAEQLSPKYNHGGIGVAWGRFYEKLPWPKRDRAKAEQALRKVLTEQNPNNLRARVFLADTLAQDGRPKEAKPLLDQVAAAPVGRYDAPEERRAKALGASHMPAVKKLLESQ